MPDFPAGGTPVFRFAPSPNGLLHLGHAHSALLNAGMALRLGGRFLIRIEDIDVVRCVPALVGACLADLAWLGLDWERPERRQSQHFADYAAALGRLRERSLVYPCFCSRRAVVEAVAVREEEIGAPWPRDPEGVPLYPGTCRARSHMESEMLMEGGAPFAWRLDMSAALAAAGSEPLRYTRVGTSGEVEGEVVCDPARWGDVVLARKDVPTSYHLAVVTDDAIQGVTHVVRGLDLEAATDIHVLLQRLFGLPTPLYHHHELQKDPSGHKLSKSRGSPSLADLRAGGVTAPEVRRSLGFADALADAQNP